MALEVNEIGIRMRVSEDGSDEPDGDRGDSRSEQADCCGLDRGEIVDDCVRRVLQVLKGMRER